MSRPSNRKSIVVTVLLVVLYRLGYGVLLPGLDFGAIQAVTAFGGLRESVLHQMSVFALGVNPYISAIVIVWLLRSLVPSWKDQGAEGTHARRRAITVATLLLALIQGLGIGRWLQVFHIQGAPLVSENFDPIIVALTLAGGAMLVVWISNQITAQGLCDGALLIYLIDLVVTRITSKVPATYAAWDGLGFVPLDIVMIGVIILGAVLVASRVEAAERRIPLKGSAQSLSLKPGWSAVYAPIFVSSLMIFPATLAAWIPALKGLTLILSNRWLGNSIYALGIVGIGYSMGTRGFNPRLLAQDLADQGSEIAGLDAGEDPESYLRRVSSRLSLGYAVYLAAMCILVPEAFARLDMTLSVSGLFIVCLVKAGMEIAGQLRAPGPAISEAVDA